MTIKKQITRCTGTYDGNIFWKDEEDRIYFEKEPRKPMTSNDLAVFWGIMIVAVLASVTIITCVSISYIFGIPTT